MLFCLQERTAFEIGDISKDVWQKKTLAELKVYEAVVKDLADKGKKIFLISVPSTPITQHSKDLKEGINFINNKLAEISQNAMNGANKNLTKVWLLLLMKTKATTTKLKISKTKDIYTDGHRVVSIKT